MTTCHLLSGSILFPFHSLHLSIDSNTHTADSIHRVGHSFCSMAAETTMEQTAGELEGDTDRHLQLALA